MNDKEKHINTLGIISIALSILIIAPSIRLLLDAITETSKQPSYNYSMYVLILIVLGTIPSLLSMILGIMAYSKYRKNKQICQNSKTIAFLAILLSISGATIMILDLLLEAYVIP